jgi:hypothetical protein
LHILGQPNTPFALPQLRWRNGEPGSSDKAVGSKCGRVDKPARNCSFATRFDCVAVTQLVTDVLYYEWQPVSASFEGAGHPPLRSDDTEAGRGSGGGSSSRDTNPPGEPNPHRLFSANPLAGLPALRQVH